MDVAEAAAATLRHLQALAVRGEVADHLVGVDIGDHGAHGHANLDVLATLAVHLAAHAALATWGLERAHVAEIDKGVEAFVGHQPHGAAASAIAAVRAAEGNELLAPEAHAAVAAVTGRDPDLRFVDEFHGRVNREE